MRLTDRMMIRKEECSNYKAAFFLGKTIRLSNGEDIKELKYPEFYDVSLGTKCNGACPECYASASTTGVCYSNIPQKIHDFFGPMTENQRPFQVAIGGGGEPTIHPEFPEILKAFHDLGIVPNYTTNGLNVTEELLVVTEELCGGVAVSCHEHLNAKWINAANAYQDKCPSVSLNLHQIISDEESVKTARDIYEAFKAQIDTLVLLPLIKMGRASDDKTEIPEKALTDWLDTVFADGKIAFGARFYEFLLKRSGKDYDVSMYPPEIMSKYLIMNDEMQIFNSSFEAVK